MALIACWDGTENGMLEEIVEKVGVINTNRQ